MEKLASLGRMLLKNAVGAPSGTEILFEMANLAEMLLEKNVAYGDSALDPARVFSKADPIEQIRVRLDDKLSRLSRGSQAGEDVTRDLMGYLVLLRIAEKRASRDVMRRPHLNKETLREEFVAMPKAFVAPDAEVEDFMCQRCDTNWPLKGKAVCEGCLERTRGKSDGKIAERTSEGVVRRS